MKNKQVILIVDDTPENLQVLGSLLEDEYEVRIATNGADALDAVKESMPDLILLDILMPIMGGYEVCRHLKADENFKIIPVIFISALGMIEQKVEAFHEGAVDYITKPFQTEEVLARVRTHLQLSKMEELKHEITERIHAEELLKQQNTELEIQYENYKLLSEKLQQTISDLEIAKNHAEESDKLKSAFLANMSHEIRTPMNGILGFAELLKEPHLSDEQQQSYISIIQQSGERMLNIINDIIDISKIESGQVSIKLEESNVNDQIKYIYDFFKPEVEEKRMQFIGKSSLSQENAIIKTDREKLFIILTNLVKNAIKFSTSGTIEFGCDLDNTKKTAQLKFYVKDSGIGIPLHRQIAIFERFIQADVSDRMARQGAGLGLTIAKSYIELLGGKIWVESEVGIGSTFYFTLPYNKEDQEIIKDKNSAPKNELENQLNPLGPKLKILIAEDDKASEMLLSLMVELYAKEVIIVKNGHDAIEACRNNPDIDLILMDIKMPDMDGLEATKRIRLFNKEVIIVAQTAYALTRDKGNAITSGCNSHITKPIKQAALHDIIKQYFLK